MATRKLIPFTLDDGICEMGNEDGCPNVASYWLDAPASYVIPLQMCAEHATEERLYFGTSIPKAVA